MIDAQPRPRPSVRRRARVFKTNGLFFRPPVLTQFPLNLNKPFRQPFLS